MRRSPLRSFWLAVVTASLTSVATPSVGSAGTVQSLWGWVTARNPTMSSYQPAAKDQGNSSGGTNTVVRNQVGEYVVTFGGLDAGTCVADGCYGTAQVTALSSSQRTCRVIDFNAHLPVTVYVTCVNRLGSPADSAFSLNYLAPRGQFGHLAYLYANDSSLGDYEPNPDYSFNSFPSATMRNRVHRFVPGKYRVELYGDTHATLQGNIQVSASDANCKIDGRYSVNSATPPFSGPTVLCRTAAGVETDATFHMVFTNGTGLRGVSGQDAYVFANRPSTASYTPAAAFRYASGGQTSTITRSGVGTYVVRMPGQPLGGSAQVTAFGTDKTMCQLSAIQKKSAPQRIGVACFKPNGSRADSRFYLTLTR
jgi:hypothetical protein